MEDTTPELKAKRKRRECTICGQAPEPLFQISLAAYRLASSDAPGQKLSLGLGHICKRCLLESVAFFKKEELLRDLIDR